MSVPRQQTIGEAREMAGVGLHTGAQVRMRLCPGEAGSGVLFRRVDLPGAPEVPVSTAHVASTDRGTVLAVGDARVHTVEHLLAALAGLGIDNVVVELDGPEPPAADGSALPLVELLRTAGRESQDAPVKVLAVSETFSLKDGDSEYVVTPSPALQLSTTIEFEHPLIRRQYGSYRVDPEAFVAEIAPARTFGFLHEAETLRARELAQGAGVDNAVVLTADGLLDGTELRFPDEFVRHKTLDLLGDLALLGARLQAHVVAQKPSHRGNLLLAREIEERAGKRANPKPILTIQQILQYLPHRYPFLLVDRVLEFEEGKRIVGLKNVTINEPFFVGHFPGHPIMPGVLIIEAMAQVGGLLVMDAIENPEDKVVYFMSLDNVKWRRPVTPGDQIRFEVEIMQIRAHTARMKGVARVDGQVVTEAEMMARVVDR